MGKACNKCQQVLPLPCFPVKRKAADGLSRWCRNCLAAAKGRASARAAQPALNSPALSQHMSGPGSAAVKHDSIQSEPSTSEPAAVEHNSICRVDGQPPAGQLVEHEKKQAPFDAGKAVIWFWAVWAMLGKLRQEMQLEPATPSASNVHLSALHSDTPATRSFQHLPSVSAVTEAEARKLSPPVHQPSSPVALPEGRTAEAVPATALDMDEAAHAPAGGSPAVLVNSTVCAPSGVKAVLLADAASLGTRACHERQQELPLDQYYTTVRNWCETCHNQRTWSATNRRQASHDADTPQAAAVSPPPSPSAPTCKARNKCDMVLPLQRFESEISNTDGRVGTYRDCRSARRTQLAPVRQQGLDCPPSGHPLGPCAHSGCTTAADAQPAAAVQEPVLYEGTDTAAPESTKACLHCQKLLPLEHYYRNRGVCKACYSQRYAKRSQPDAPAQPPHKKARVSNAHPSSTAAAAWRTVTAALQRHQDGPVIPASKQCLRCQEVQPDAVVADERTCTGMDSSCRKTVLKPAELPFAHPVNDQPIQQCPSGTQGGGKCGLDLSSSVPTAAASAGGAGAIEGSKPCRRCLRLLPRTSFDAECNNADGLRSWCEVCRAEQCKQCGGAPAGQCQDPSALAGGSTKQCSRCLRLLSCTSFHVTRRNPDGLASCCKPCRAEQWQKYRGTPAGPRQPPPAHGPESTKRCCRCRRMLSRAAFGAHSGHSDGLSGQCRECKSDTRKAQHTGNAPQGQASASSHGPGPVAPTLHLQQHLQQQQQPHMASTSHFKQQSPQPDMTPRCAAAADTPWMPAITAGRPMGLPAHTKPG